MDTCVKGHHAYKDTWTPEIGESHGPQIKTSNPVDKYAVCIRQFRKVVRHLKKGENDKFENVIFFFLRGDPNGCTVHWLIGEQTLSRGLHLFHCE